MRNLYEVLGVTKEADQATIRKAFRTLARRYHPDVSKEADAEKRFKEINAAYQVLSDEEKRSLYDEFGEDALRQGFNAETARAWRSAGGGRGGTGPNPFHGGFGGGPGGVDIEDLLGNLFRGGGSFGGRPDRRAPRAGPNLETTRTIDLLTALRGGELQLALRRPSPCAACHGEGGTGRRTCSVCQGAGQVRQRRLGMDSVVLCDECAGSGETFAQECPSCAGSGRVTLTKQIKVRVPCGVTNGQTIRLRGQGGEGKHGGPAGDLLLSLEVEPHVFLRRIGTDLEMDLPLKMSEAMGGAKITVPTFDGEVKVRVPPGSQNGKKLRLREKGFANQDGTRGDIILVLRPTVPENPSPEDIVRAQEIDSNYPEDPRKDLQLDS